MDREASLIIVVGTLSSFIILVWMGGKEMSRLVGALSGGMNGMNGMNGNISMNTGNSMVYLCEIHVCGTAWWHWLVPCSGSTLSRQSKCGLLHLQSQSSHF